MKSYTISEYHDANCPEVRDMIGYALHGLTGGRICDNGCNRFKSGRCPAYLKLTLNDRVNTVKPKEIEYTETVRAEAARRNMSIKKVRAERRDKANDEMKHKELRLEVGKAYRATDGRVVTIECRNHTEEPYPFIGSNGLSYTTNGRYFLDHPIPGYDLEEEIKL